LYLNPVGSNLADGIKDGAGVGGGDNPGGSFGVIDGPCTRFQFTEKEFIEGPVAIEFGYEELFRCDFIRCNKVGLHSVSKNEI
jgi:hypothetical protein